MDVGQFLAEAPQAPKREQVDAAISMLQKVGAVDAGGRRLTPLGRHLSGLGVDVKVGKVLLYACAFRCVEKGLTIAAVMAVGKSLFQKDFDDSGGPARKAAVRSFQVDGSDWLTACEVWRQAEINKR